MIVKNSFGISVFLRPKHMDISKIGEFAGSSLDRKKEEKAKPKSSIPEKDGTESNIQVRTEKTLRSLSSRTKSKIRKKLHAFFGMYKKLTFLTLTFVNSVSDELGIKVLAKFLENIKKQDTRFEFLWVAERQNKNQVFKGNIHFHLITNKYWKIDKVWKYWLDLQKKHGIIPREESFTPTSSFDVKAIASQSVKSIGIYLTKYVTKNNESFKCQVWNCSKRISALYTDFYTDLNFIKELERLEKANELDIKRVQEEYCNLMFYPITKTTNRFYDRLHNKNKETWNTLVNNQF
jgi:hypothetical protein